jgi:hypothetical protein
VIAFEFQRKAKVCKASWQRLSVAATPRGGIPVQLKAVLLPAFFRFK